MLVAPRTLVRWKADHSPRGIAEVKAMAQVLNFRDSLSDRDGSARNGAALRNRLDEDESYSFWPEVSSGLWVKHPVPVNPENSPQRVLSEMMLIVGGAGLLVLLATIFLGVPSP